ncbi:MAG: Mur ligase domain-containing protein, partial [Candidatus Planktophila sp.]
MISLQASEIARIVGGSLHGTDCSVTAPAFLSSSQCTPGSLFLAIKGERVDGHDFAADAFTHGAVLVLASRVLEQRCIVVEDVTIAIGKLAAHVRSQLSELVVVGITGSQGKTTTKELLSAILSAHGSTVSPKGNNNNELG